MNVQKTRTWKCPICSKSCQNFFIDSQQSEILKIFKEKYNSEKENISKEVTFHCDGRTLFNEDKEVEEEDNHSNASLKIEKAINKQNSKK